jgi:septal ring factor EnvC (AmiA/AmiB activator)
MKTIKVYDSTWRRDVVIPIASIKYAGRSKDGGTVIFLADNQEIFTDRDLDAVQAMINGEEPTVVSVVVEELQRQVNELKDQCSTAKIELKSWQHDSRHAWARVSELETELGRLRKLHNEALDCVDEVFQSDSTKPPPVLPDFLMAGEDKFEGVIKLAERYKQLLSKAEELRPMAKETLRLLRSQTESQSPEVKRLAYRLAENLLAYMGPNE